MSKTKLLAGVLLVFMLLTAQVGVAARSPAGTGCKYRRNNTGHYD